MSFKLYLSDIINMTIFGTFSMYEQPKIRSCSAKTASMNFGSSHIKKATNFMYSFNIVIKSKHANKQTLNVFNKDICNHGFNF
jgi:hypothetical protein